jgi:phytoene dehydrogenase-like protein
VARTRANIRAFSKDDADTYDRLFDAYEKHLKKAFGQHRFSLPPPWGTPDPLEKLLSTGGSMIEPVHQFMSVRQLAYDYFESDELRTLFMRAATTSTGCYPDDVMGLQGLIHVLGLTLSFEPAAIAVGGTGAVTAALTRAGSKRGVSYFTKQPVDEIIESEGRAAGIRLADGTRINASLVVSDLGLPQTVLGLMRNSSVAQRIKQRLRNIHYDRGQLLWANIATHEAPDYAASAGNPEVGLQPRLYWGPKDPDWLATRYQAEIFTRGISSRLFVLSSTDSLWDTTRAPAGKHLTGVEEFTAPLRLFDRDGWKRIEKEFEEALRRQWPLYAKNMTGENIISVHLTTPRGIFATHPDMIEGGYTAASNLASQLGRFRPIADLAGYKTLLPNLYTCSSNVHSSSGIGRGSSYNCWRQIAADLGIDPDAEHRKPGASADSAMPADIGC